MSLPVVAVTIVFLALLTVLLFAVARMLRMGLHDDGRLRLAELLERRGAKLEVDALDTYAPAIAARRCVYCTAKKECDAWLASGKRDGYAQFCPNAEFVARRPNR